MRTTTKPTVLAEYWATRVVRANQSYYYSTNYIVYKLRVCEQMAPQKHVAKKHWHKTSMMDCIDWNELTPI